MCNIYRKKGIKTSLHRFPRENVSLYKKWLQVTAIKEEDELKYNLKICNNCFDSSDFVISNDEKKKLKPDSCPKARIILGKRNIIEETSVSICYFCIFTNLPT